ncbi:MAG: hypothetical protein WAW80_00515 [Candidatus Saccharimonadales bacterium]
MTARYLLHAVFYPQANLGYSIEQIDEIGRMRGGWANRYHKQ